MASISVLKYKIRVILSNLVAPIPTKQFPHDVEGTILAISPGNNYTAKLVLIGNLYPLITGEYTPGIDRNKIQGTMQVRWDHDTKMILQLKSCVLRSSKLSLCSSIWGEENQIIMDTRPYHELLPTTSERVISIADVPHGWVTPNHKKAQYTYQYTTNESSKGGNIGSYGNYAQKTIYKKYPTPPQPREVPSRSLKKVTRQSPRQVAISIDELAKITYSKKKAAPQPMKWTQDFFEPIHPYPKDIREQSPQAEVSVADPNIQIICDSTNLESPIKTLKNQCKEGVESVETWVEQGLPREIDDF